MSCVQAAMPALRDFEIQAIRLLAAGTLTDDQLAAMARIAEPTRYEYTGGGYFLTVSDPSLPAAAVTLGHPNVVGEHEDIRVGFIVFLRDHELTLECHTWGAVDPPPDFRDRPVVIGIEPMNIVDLR